MPERITMAVLANKIDNLADEIKEIKVDIKDNTVWRLQAKGFTTAVAFISGGIGAGFVFLFNKIF